MKLPDKDRKRALDLLATGMNRSQVAKEVGCSWTTVDRWMKASAPKGSDALVPDFVSPELIMPETVLYRYHEDGLRRYYTLEPFEVYIGITSALDATMPDDIQLKRYMCSFRDYDHYKENLDELADFGTIYHILCAEVAWKGVSVDSLEERMIHEAVKMGYSEAWGRKHTRRMNKYLFSFLQFVQDKEVEFLGIELPIVIREFGVATCIDYVIRLRFNQKMRLAILDLKSGANTYLSHQCQLKACEIGLKLTYPQFQDEPIMLFNLNPSDWKTKPTYKLTNQTGKVGLAQLERYLGNLRHHARIKPADVLRFSGTVGPGTNPENHYEWTPFEEIIYERNK